MPTGLPTGALEVRRLTKRYGAKAAVREVSFAVPAGEVTGYLGPNGSGKSTTLKMLAGLLEPTAGEILLGGQPVERDWVAFKGRLGYVPEEPHLYPYLSVEEHLQLVGRLRGLPEARLTARIGGLLEALSLGGDRRLALSACSKGMRQKVLIAAALLHDPDVLLFDEPLSGLDVTSRAVFRDLLAELARSGKAILYSSHVLPSVEQVCSHVVILDRGRVVADDSVAALKELTRLPSLEGVFARLVEQGDTAAVARDLVAATRL